MTKQIDAQPVYSSMYNNDDQLFANEQIQRYDADTIKNRYGDNWRNYASNVREIKQADGSIVREYIIEDPSLLKEIKPSLDSTSSTTGSDDEQQSSKHKFAQIKAKFEKSSLTNVMASPSTSLSLTGTNRTGRQNSDKQTNDLYPKNRQGSSDSLAINRTTVDNPGVSRISSNFSQNVSNSHHSQSSSSSSFRRLNSAEEADEEVQRIHRQGEDFQQHRETLTPISSINENKQQKQRQQETSIQYEVLDENGNPISIDGVPDLIKMSGVTAREVQQPNGTYVREYVIDDPDILSKFHKQQSPMVSQQQPFNHNIPPPPPRIPLKQSVLFHQGVSNHDQNIPINIENIRVLEAQRRYEYTTTSGKRIEFMITHLASDNQTINDSDIRELSGAINNRLMDISSSSSSVLNSTQQQKQPYNLPKQWNPAVDLTVRGGQARQRTGSDNQSNSNTYNMNFQQTQPIQTDLARSASYGALHQGSYQQPFEPVFTEPIIDWSALQQQDPQGQLDPQLIRQFIAQKHQGGGFQTSAQFLPAQKPQQTTRSIHSPSRFNAPVYYQQQISHPYQRQQQQYSVNTINNTNDMTFHHYHHQHEQQQQQPTMTSYDHTRI